MKKSKLEKSLLTYTDIFGVQAKLQLNQEDTYRTNVGALFTIFYLFVSISLFFGFGVDMYQRTNPRVTFNTETVPHIKTNYSNDGFTYAYRIEDTNGKFFSNNSILSTIIYYGLYEQISGVWQLKIAKLIEQKRCSEFPNLKQKEEYFNISLKEWYCIDVSDLTMGGSWSSDFVSTILINAQQCINSTINNNSCLPQEIIQNSFNNKYTSAGLFYSDLTLYAEPKMNDYENPLKNYLVNSFQMLGVGMSKRKIQTFKTTAINDDRGWFYKNIIEQKIISTDTVQFDSTLKDYWSQDVLYSSFLYFGNRKDVYNRNYTKIQEVIATIGGFTKLFYVLIEFIFSYLSVTIRDIYIGNNNLFNEDFLASIDSTKRENTSKDNKNERGIRRIEIQRNPTLFEHKKEKLSIHSYICSCFLKKNKKIILRKYDLLRYYYNSKMDLLNYFKLNQNVAVLKKLILNKNQREILKLVYPKLNSKKTNIQFEENMTSTELGNIKVRPINSLNLNDEKTKLLFSMLEKNVQKQFI
jgi:hypothetical protein